jgi:hypothetical protein
MEYTECSKVTNVVVVSVTDGVGGAEALVVRAAVADISGTRERMGELVKGSAATDVARRNRSAAAEAGGGHLAVEGRAEA